MVQFAFLVRFLWNYICNRIRRLFLPYLLRRAERMLRNPGVFHLTSSTYLKISTFEKIQLEVEATRFARANTTIPIPEVYDFWRGADGKGYMVTEKMPGEPARKCFARLTEDQRYSLARKIRGEVEKLRVLEQPEPKGWICNVGGKPLVDHQADPRRIPIGPFVNEAAFHDWRARHYQGEYYGPATHKENWDKIQKYLWDCRMEEFRDDHEIFFTHGDLNKGNILLQIDGPGPDDVRISGIVDWAEAGWRPAHWERVKLLGWHRLYYRILNGIMFPEYAKDVSSDVKFSYICGLR